MWIVAWEEGTPPQVRQYQEEARNEEAADRRALDLRKARNLTRVTYYELDMGDQ